MSSAQEKDRREQVAKAYHGLDWADKVKKMSDAQIYALFIKFKAQGKI